MAQIDSNIALGYKPIQIESPINQMANMYQLQGAQQANQLRDMQMQAAQREMEQQNALANAYKQSVTPTGDLDYETLKRNLAAGGQGAQIPGIVKSQREVQKATAEARKADTDAIDSALKTSQALLQQVRTPDQYLAWHDLNHDNQYLAPIFDKLGVTRESARASIQDALQKPGGFENLLQQSQLGIEKFAAMNKPIAVGGSLMTPQGQVIGTAPKEFAPPAAQQEYDLAKSQGYTGSFLDYKRELAAAGRAPAAAPAVTLATIQDPKDPTKTIVVDARSGRTIGQGTKEGSGVELPAKERQKREASYPQATSSVKGFEAKSDAFIKDLKALRDDPGLENITGVLYGRTPSYTAAGRRAEALYNKVTAKGGFQALQDMREASKTGGALGNVSNQEGKQLTSSFAAIDRKQDAADVRAAIDQAIADIEGSKVRMREAYDQTYDYRAPRAAATSSVRSQADAILNGGR